MTEKNNENYDGPRILKNGTILTMDSDNSTAEAIAVRNGRIEAVGTNREINQLISEESFVVDLEGKTMLPGFIEAHGHFPWSGFNAVGVNLNSPPIGTMTCISEIIEALKKKAAETENGKWVLYDPRQEPTCGPNYWGRVFELNTQGDERPLEGIIKYSILSGFRLLFRNDTLKIQVRIQDRALNRSNIVETEPFLIQDKFRQQ